MGIQHTALTHLLFGVIFLLPILALFTTSLVTKNDTTSPMVILWMTLLFVTGIVQAVHLGGAQEKPHLHPSAYRWPFVVAGGMTLLLAMSIVFQFKDAGTEMAVWKTLLFTATTSTLLYLIVSAIADLVALYQTKISTRAFWILQAIYLVLTCFFLTLLYFIQAGGNTSNSRVFLTVWKFIVHGLVTLLLIFYSLHSFFTNPSSGPLACSLFFFAIILLWSAHGADENWKPSSIFVSLLSGIVLLSALAITTDMRSHWIPATVWTPIIPAVTPNPETKGVDVAGLPSGYVLLVEAMDGSEHKLYVPLPVREAAHLASTPNVRGIQADIHVGRFVRNVLEVYRLKSSDDINVMTTEEALDRMQEFALDNSTSETPIKVEIVKRTDEATRLRSSTYLILTDTTPSLFVPVSQVEEGNKSRFSEKFNMVLIYAIIFFVIALLHLANQHKHLEQVQKYGPSILILLFALLSIGLAVLYKDDRLRRTFYIVCVTISAASAFTTAALIGLNGHAAGDDNRLKKIYRTVLSLSLYLVMASPLGLVILQHPK